MKHNGSSFCTNSRLLPNKKSDNCICVKSTFWHRVGQCSNLCSQYFLYVFAEIKRLFFENLAWKLGTTFSNRAAIWFFRQFLIKRIWKTRYYYFFCTNLLKKGIGCIKGHVTRPWPKGKRNLLRWKNHVTMTQKDAYKSNKVQLRSYFWRFLHKI